MGKLKIEEKAKRYDEILVKLQKAKVDNNVCDKRYCCVIDDIVPELKEDKDEVIKKKLKHFLEVKRCCTNNDEEYRDCNQFLAWLEKQGEQKPAAIEAWKEMRLEVYAQASGNRHEPNCSDDKTKMFSLSDIDEIIEKISNQKPADVVKPKFKAGDWIISKYMHLVMQILNNDNRSYETVEIDGTKRNDSYDFIERNFKLWTIQDAKDGDVLASQECLVIFKCIDGLNIKCYCTYHHLGFNPNFSINTLHNKVWFYPATKEQREKLEKAISDAGYEWDNNTKDLKKIEQKKLINKVKPKFNIGDTMRTLKEASNGITNGLPVVVSIDDEYYHCTNELIAIKDQDDYEYPPMNRKQKPIDEEKSAFEQPKFHEGEWIICTELNAARIISIVNDRYKVEFMDGNKGFPHIDFIDRNFHLWTIQNAKDGDVLVNGSNIFIFRCINSTCLMGYCYVNIDDKRFYDDIGKNECFCLIDAIVNPATKEQRDLLFQKMKEAGYVWDAEKKELKKIEQKSVWSKEDERWIDRACMLLNELNDLSNLTLAKIPYNVNDIISHLKSIKDKYSWKPSEEQLHELNNVFNDTSAGWEDSVIESLYYDLKKL